MSKDRTVKFATFGPNRGLSLTIGSYDFTNGICEVPESHVASATSVLFRYHDVCYERDLEEKAKAYDAEYADKGPKPVEKPEADSGSRTNVGDDPLINEANAETAKALGKAEGGVDNKEPEAEGEKANDNKGSDSEGNEGSDAKSNNKKKGK